MTTTNETSAGPILDSLKDFQRRTVHFAFNRLWGPSDPVDKFLVADEVGLGKTMVAKGLIALAVDHLKSQQQTVDIVYICSNQQIARQNIRRLNAVGGHEEETPDRLTLLPPVIRELRARSERVHLLAFTPSTSMRLDSGGKAAERVLLYWMLARAWKSVVADDRRWVNFFRIGKGLRSFSDELEWFDQESLDDQMCDSFGEEVMGSEGPQGGRLGDELKACAAEFDEVVDPSPDLSWRRVGLVAQLRRLVAHSAVRELKPSLVILDEFQRFKDLLDPDADNEGARLAQALIYRPGTKVLMLSATPYRMYTLPDEPEGDDHYQDFADTIRLLAGRNRAETVQRQLGVIRRTLLTGGDLEPAMGAKAAIETELRRVMCRTERLAQVRGRDDEILRDPTLAGVRLTTEDLVAWRTFDDVARLVDHRDVFEYWRSTPYALNLMDRGGYQIRKRFDANRDNPRLAAVLESGRGLLDVGAVRELRPIDPGNPKMRGLIQDVVDRAGAWRIAWIPPSLPYYALGGAFADPQVRAFTKRLIFSRWTVVPKSISVLLSYEAERRAAVAAKITERTQERPPLQFRTVSGSAHDQDMPGLALLYPALELARAGDPLEIAKSRAVGDAPMSRENLLAVVRERIQERLDDPRMPKGDPPNSPIKDERWYWVAPFLLDRALAETETADFFSQMDSWHSKEDREDPELQLTAHLDEARTVRKWVKRKSRNPWEPKPLGSRPDDLADVLARMAVAGPGVCALRALSRVTGGTEVLVDPQIRRSAYRIAHGFRTLFNRREIITLLRSEPRLASVPPADQRAHYWKAVLDHGVDGCLQAVLDEYVHMLVESEGLQDADATKRADTLELIIRSALRYGPSTYRVSDLRAEDGAIPARDPLYTGAYLAASFVQTQATSRGVSVRTAFNSPFRPFVVASTSVGQEGLDFHTYCHAVVHWNLPANPVDLEQREGRVHRYKGHAVRKNVAMAFGNAAFRLDDLPSERIAELDKSDPWAAMFAAAESARGADSDDMQPYWVFTHRGGAAIERYVPALPLSREAQHYHRLQRTLGAYRLVMGQPRQADLLRYIGDVGIDASSLAIDLSPPADGDRDL